MRALESAQRQPRVEPAAAAKADDEPGAPAHQQQPVGQQLLDHSPARGRQAPGRIQGDVGDGHLELSGAGPQPLGLGLDEGVPQEVYRDHAPESGGQRPLQHLVLHGEASAGDGQLSALVGDGHARRPLGGLLVAGAGEYPGLELEPSVEELVVGRVVVAGLPVALGFLALLFLLGLGLGLGPGLGRQQQERAGRRRPGARGVGGLARQRRVGLGGQGAGRPARSSGCGG